MQDKLSKKLKEKGRELGADVIGIAGAEGFQWAPEGHKPWDILPGATCAVSMGFAHPNTVIEKAMPTQYARSMFTNAARADHAANSIALLDRRRGTNPFHLGPVYIYREQCLI